MGVPMEYIMKRRKTMNPELNNIRESLNEIDDEMLSLLKKRQKLSESIYRAKKGTLAPIYMLQQENQKIAALDDIDDDIRNVGKPFLKTVMRLSREKQYHMARKDDPYWKLGLQILQSQKERPSILTIATQGNTGSYSYKAAKNLHPDSAIITFPTFESACTQVIEGNVDAAVLPLENSTAGTVDEVYGLLDSNKLYITETTGIEIRHHLMGVKGSSLESIETVISHPQALAQCSSFIQSMGWKTEISGNTAFAAKEVQKRNSLLMAAIGSEEAARNNGLELIMSEISNVVHNQTRFVLLSALPYIAEDANTCSLVIRLAHEPGSLSALLSLFSDRDISLSRILSRPVPKKPWEYTFHIDCNMSPTDESALDLLYQLEQETLYMHIIGWYKE
ncbi:bifunctional chorismate mutase/prephenate dehydratase [Parasporobacterium paucivorans]|uniref:Bifunctional chorismate mutase/prephenate dehydratase n=1 Tax=Parasporobacterium paucivorans DSM 15970 TaxID=1122934 RepID=A0A1M6DP93_9FIRM|nr:bifunctional chorismate mutase/prephenate dehydratase [Parasporobacterium paucivorans]SHI75057.1 chorismate mutase / prephenate dehydratase [Parasporobacterium paucivorans DSM 15970]